MKTSAFITNDETKQLKQRIIELIQFSKELRFLVGFFYFSGINELYEEIKNNPEIQIDVLVGLYVDKTLHGLNEFGDVNEEQMDRERAERFFDSINKSINSDEFDTKDFYEKVKFYVELIRNDKLRIRKTRKPNHAKLYIFNVKDEFKTLKKCAFVTGSSNLTRAGISLQNEFNVEISDFGTVEANDYFTKLWDDAESIKITENEDYKKKLIELIENRTLITEVTPFEAFAFVLKNYLDIQNQQIVKTSLKELLIKKGYKPYQYQLDAVGQALTVINNQDTPNGIIVSDVVGLGKSIIASLIAKSLGKRGIIICPPGIMGDVNKKTGWEKYKEDFGLYDWEIRSCGLENLQRTLELIKANDEYEVIIIDEVHRFRNQDTEAYEVLSNICRDKIVILLSATPFNNTPADIFSLLKLFVIPGKSKISLDNDLNYRFKGYNYIFKKLSNIKKNYQSTDGRKKERAINDYESLFGDRRVDLIKVRERAKYLATSIRQVIEPILIRRNRIDLKKDPVYSQEVYGLSEIKDPIELFFELDDKQSEFYDSITKIYFGEDESRKFKGAIYRPYIYEAGISEGDEIDMEENREALMQKNLFDFMRRLIVKRFESSFGAFEKSIGNFYRITDKVQKFIQNSGGKFILDRRLMEDIYDLDIDEIEGRLLQYEQKLGEGNYPKSWKVYDTNSSVFKLKEQFLSDIESDKQLFKELLDKLGTLNLVENDPKFERLIIEIKKILSSEHPLAEPQRKVIVFTEYSDTASYLEDKLEAIFPGRILSTAGGLTNTIINEILENFDAAVTKQKDAFQILLATDKISEGFNLNRAGSVINYDIPWNPTRVIQRVGRINRIGKKVFNELFIYNFFPTEKGAEYVKSREIASEKMFLIHNTLGEDAKIFEIDEEPSASKLFSRIMENPEKMEEESFQTKVRRDYAEILSQHPDTIERISELPIRVKSAKKYPKDMLCAFIRKGFGFYSRVTEDGKEVEELPFEGVYKSIECKYDEIRLPLSVHFWDWYSVLKTVKEQVRRASGATSLENRAKSNLQTLIHHPPSGFIEHIGFARILLEDILEYKTLSDYTLRRLVNLNTTSTQKDDINKIIAEFVNFKSVLGADYLEKIKEKLGDLHSEVIIGIENIKG